MQYYLIYRVTNLKDGKYYIGKHKTEQIDDGYLGSGTLISRAVRKYGAENFSKEILAYAEDEAEMDMLEKQYVSEEVVKDPMSYNLTIGGRGGFWHINAPENIERYVSKRRDTISRWDPEYKAEVDAMKAHHGQDNYWYGKDRSGEKNPMYGKKHSEDTIKVLSDKAKSRPPTRIGATNSDHARETARQRNSRNWLIMHPDGRFEVIRNLTKFLRDNQLPGSLENHFRGWMKHKHKSGFDGCRIPDCVEPIFSEEWIRLTKPR